MPQIVLIICMTIILECKFLRGTSTLFFNFMAHRAISLYVFVWWASFPRESKINFRFFNMVEFYLAGNSLNINEFA